MDERILRLIPKRYLCPYCGEWHKWDKPRRTLKSFNSVAREAEFKCFNAPKDCNSGSYSILFVNGLCYYDTLQICGRASQNIAGNIPISSIVESADEPIVTFDVNFTSYNNVGSIECGGRDECPFKEKCNCVKLGDKGDHRHMKITFGFEFEQSDYEKYAKVMYFVRKEKELKTWEKALSSREKELEAKEHALQEENLQEKNTMLNIFNTSMEFGPNKDKGIVSTLMGVAVKNGESWRIYDKNKKEIIDVGDIQLGNLPMFILPTTKLVEGDLIKDAGEYYFVMKIEDDSIQTMCVRTGEMRNIIPIKNVLGFSSYSKVIALSDSINIGDNFDVEKLAIMSAACGQLSEGQNVSMNQLLLLMLINKKDIGNDDKTKMLLMMSSMMGGNNGSNNPMISYLMLDMMEKK